MYALHMSYNSSVLRVIKNITDILQCWCFALNMHAIRIILNTNLMHELYTLYRCILWRY